MSSRSISLVQNIALLVRGCCCYVGNSCRSMHYLSSSATRQSLIKSKWSTLQFPSVYLSTSTTACGLEEFFQTTSDYTEEGESAGREWKVGDLRQKSNDDLHKLWYVLLKERNVLLTLKHEANRFRYKIPAPERMHKVKKAMACIKLVIHERRIAIVEAKEKLGLISGVEAEEEKMTEEKRIKHRKLRRREEYHKGLKKIKAW